MRCQYCDKTPETDKHFRKSKQMCNAHFIQIRRHGKVLENHRKSPHKIRWYDDYFEMSLSNNKGEIVAWTKVDKEDYGRVIQHKWHLDKYGYAVTKNKISIKLHQFIIGIVDDMVIDHIFRDRLDNRKSFLRHITYSESNLNRSLQSNSSSGETGVCFDKNRKKWIAHIGINGKFVFIGYYDSIESAKKARITKEKELYREGIRYESNSY